MSKRHPITVDLNDYRDTKYREGVIKITAGDESFEIPPPELWQDDWITDDVVQQAKNVLGDRYDAFIEAGGTSMMVNSIVKEYGGLTPGE